MRDELPLFKFLMKSAYFTLWWAGSILFLFVVSYLIIFQPLVKKGEMAENLFDPSRPYHLFRTQPSQAQVLGTQIQAEDARSEILKNYLRDYHSPLADYAKELISVADKFALPWTLLPAIAGKESGFGKVIPFGSYNAWGWGIYSGQSAGLSFSSWEEAIKAVASGLREDYFDKGVDTVEEIEAYYTPSSLDRGHTWRDGVNYFIWEIENYSNY